MNFETPTPTPESEKTLEEREAALIAKFEKSEYWEKPFPGVTGNTIKKVIELEMYYGGEEAIAGLENEDLDGYKDVPHKYFEKYKDD